MLDASFPKLDGERRLMFAELVKQVYIALDNMTESAMRVRPESRLKHCVSCLMQHVIGKIRKRTKQRGQKRWSPTAKTMRFRYKLSIYYNSSFLGVAVHLVAL